MDDDKIREVAGSIVEGDKITVGRLDVKFTVDARPLEDGDKLMIEASRKHYPRQNVVTELMILFHPNAEKNLTISKSEMKDRPSTMDGYISGEELDSQEYNLERLSVLS